MKVKTKKGKLLLIGWDAADWNVINPLLGKGYMPTLKKMMQNGVYGNMSTMNPPYSPMLWTTVATGKTPDKHGILGFVEPLEDNSGIRPITSTNRKSRALWNVFHNQNLKSNIVGWWPSFPAEPINGNIITDKFQKVTLKEGEQLEIPDRAIHPKSYHTLMKDLRMLPEDIVGEHIVPFFPLAEKIDQTKEKGMSAAAKIIAENTSVHNAITRLLRTESWDFSAVYYDLIDHFCHAYMKFHPPKLDNVDENQYNYFKDAVIGAYRYQDMMLERLLQLVDEDTTVIVMSDHGFESGDKRYVNYPKVQAAAALDHAQFGIFVATGPNIKKNEKVYGLGLVDIAPTILHHFGLPVGEDMDGKVALDIFKEITPIKYIKSWEEIEGDFGELEQDFEVDLLKDDETMQQLIDLGYIDKPDEKLEKAVKKTKADLNHNLAKVFIGKKEYTKAEHILLKLVQENEGNLTPYYVDLISICLAKNNFDKAKEYLNHIKSSKSRIDFNLIFYESSILLGQKKTKKALDLLSSELKNTRKASVRAELLYRIAKIRYHTGNYHKAKENYNEAIKLEPAKAKYLVGMAETCIELNRLEDAIDYALISIELVKFNSNAHYVLGKALEKIGDLENAKLAYNTSATIERENSAKAKMAEENVELKINTPIHLTDKLTTKYYNNQITVVSGLPRSGTSLMMQMLSNGGLEVLTDNQRKADLSNPKGYFEYEPVMSLNKDNNWLGDAQNKAIKIVAPLLKYINNDYRYKVIFMKRDLDEVVISQQKMLGNSTDTMPVHLYNSYYKQLELVDRWKGKHPGVELIYVDYKQLINSPEKELNKVENFLGVKLDKVTMKKAINKSLYRNRSKN